MNYFEIIADVIKDYKRVNEVSFPEEVIRNGLACVIEPIANRLDEGDIYALCMESLYYLQEAADDINEISPEEAKGALTELFSKSLEVHLTQIESFRWIPEPLEKVYQLGYALFEKAKEAYFDMDDIDINDNCDALFDEMVNARQQLDSVDYVYSDHDEIIRLYEEEISESQLDLNTIKGNKFLLSLRLSEFIRTIHSDPDGEDVDFSLENPFSMPEDLFQ